MCRRDSELMHRRLILGSSTTSASNLATAPGSTQNQARVQAAFKLKMHHLDLNRRQLNPRGSKAKHRWWVLRCMSERKSDSLFVLLQAHSA